MIGGLPKKLTVHGIEYDIRSDYRDCLNILQCLGDPDFTYQEKLEVMLRILYVNWEDIPDSDIQEAVDKAVWFLDCGEIYEEDGKRPTRNMVLFDWEQDEQLIFAAVNHVAGKELRACEYVHFWTFISYFHEIGEGLFSTVIYIREKKQKGKLDKADLEFYRKNRNLINLKKKYSKEQQEEIDRINAILNG